LKSEKPKKELQRLEASAIALCPDLDKSKWGINTVLKIDAETYLAIEPVG